MPFLRDLSTEPCGACLPRQGLLQAKKSKGFCRRGTPSRQLLVQGPVLRCVAGHACNRGSESLPSATVILITAAFLSIESREAGVSTLLVRSAR